MNTPPPTLPAPAESLDLGRDRHGERADGLMDPGQTPTTRGTIGCGERRRAEGQLGVSRSVSTHLFYFILFTQRQKDFVKILVFGVVHFCWFFFYQVGTLIALFVKSVSVCLTLG